MRQRKWAVIEHLSEIVQSMPNGRRYTSGGKGPRISNAILFLEALGMISRESNWRGALFKITPIGKAVLRMHISKSLLGETYDPNEK